MSVNTEFNLLKQPSNNRAVRLSEDLVAYFRGNTVITLNTATGKSESRELIIPHSKSIKAIACHPNYGQPGQSLLAIAFDTGTICLFDCEKDILIPAHTEHRTRSQLGWIGLYMTADGAIVSIVEKSLVHYCSVSKRTKTKDLLPKTKFNATELSGTAWDSNLLAIGSNCGLVVIVSLKDLSVKYSFRGHDYQVTSIVWMRDISNASQGQIEDDDDCFDVYNDAHFRDDFGVEKPKVRESAFKEEPENSPSSSNKNFDFAEACQSLKEEMMTKKGAKDQETPKQPRQPNREDCKRSGNVDESNEGSLASGFSNESNASSNNIENMFEKIDLNEVEDLTLVTLDQHNNVWVWDVQLNCAKGNFKITSRGSHGNRYKKQQPVYHTSQIFLLGDNCTLVGNTSSAAYFSLRLHFDMHKNKLDFDYQVIENNSIVLTAVGQQKYLAFYSYHAMRVMEHLKTGDVKVAMELPLYNSIGRTIAVSDVNPMRIAIGSHEMCFFDLTTVTDTKCNFTTYYKNIKSAIVSLAWHPDNEVLAFGTLEGRIGLYNAQNNSVELLKPFSGNEIYDLAFGKLGEEVHLFATCSNGSCVSYFNKFSEFKYILQGIKNVSSLFVDNVLKKLFIGTKLGQVYHTDLNSIYSLKESSLRPIKVSKTYIRMFRVNCDDTKLAVASKSSDVSIIPIDQLDSEADPTLLRLKGHSQPIVWVDFSSKNPDLLLSTSYDSALRTWDVSKGVATKSTTADDVSEETIVVSSMACYEFNVKLKYAIFSPLNENCIIVGTHSTPFYVFNWTTKTKEFPPTIVNSKSSAIKDQEGSGVETQAVTKPTGNGVQHNNSSASAKANESKVIDAKKNETTIFYLAKRESTKKVLQCLQSMVHNNIGADDAEENENKVTDTDFLNKKIFSDDLDHIKDFLLEEVRNYKASNMKSRGTELIALMGGNVKETIVEHIKDKSITDEMVALAPMVSHNFWKLCVEGYSMQLIEEGQPLKAVLYLLGIHKVEDSLQILCEKNYYREAWILAKMKRSPGDAIFKELSSKWMHNLDICGDYESAAIVAAGIGDYQCALDQLMKRREEQLTEEHRAVIKSLKAKTSEGN